MTLNADTIVDELPAGYRWATEQEADAWPALADQMVQVRVGPNDQTDLAIRAAQ